MYHLRRIVPRSSHPPAELEGSRIPEQDPGAPPHTHPHILHLLTPVQFSGVCAGPSISIYARGPPPHLSMYVLVPPLAFMLEVHLLTLRQSIAGQCVSFVPSHKCDADKTWLLQETVLEVFHINMSIGLIKLVSHFLCSKCSGNLLIVERLFGGKLHELIFSKEAPTPAESEQSGSSQSHPCVEPLLLGHRLKANAVKRSLYKKMTFGERFGELN